MLTDKGEPDERDSDSSKSRKPDAGPVLPSRVQSRLLRPQSQDRTFLKVLRQKRSRPSQLGVRLRAERTRKRWWRGSLFAVVMTLSVTGVAWAALFIQGKVTYQGVPYSVVRKFWQDEAAKAAYFAGDKQALHDRLSLLGIEQDIKRYYRPQFESEYELDLYIHQIMFDRTGYVGEAYQVDRNGRLISR